MLSTSLFSQAWKRERIELVGAAGVTSFWGELGGSADEGGNYGPKDTDWSSTRWALSGAYRFYMRRNMAIKGALTFGYVYGDDAESQNETRRQRGLKFRSMIVELSAQYEIYFLTERTKGMYRLRGSRGLKKLKFDAYAFIGIGAFFFNPQNEKDGTWYNLQPFGTEGQTSGNGQKYSRVQGVVPLGLGFKKKINRNISLGLEFGVRFTTTDYIDDVSSTYWHRDAINAANGDQGDLAEYFSNPNDDSVWPSVTYSQDGTSYTLQQRGDPSQNDTYMFSMITVNYKWRKRRRSMPKF